MVRGPKVPIEGDLEGTTVAEDDEKRWGWWYVTGYLPLQNALRELCREKDEDWCAGHHGEMKKAAVRTLMERMQCNRNKGNAFVTELLEYFDSTHFDIMKCNICESKI